MLLRFSHSLLAASLLVPAIHAQDVVVSAVVRLESTPEIEEDRHEGRVHGLTFPVGWKPADAAPDELPLKTARCINFAGAAGVARWRIGRAPAGRFVVMAGGIDSLAPLQIFWFDLRSGEGILEALSTGGLELPPSFHAPAGSTGSWPVFIRDIALFAYEDKGGVSFRAKGFGQDLQYAEDIGHKSLAAIDRFDLVKTGRKHFLGIRFSVPHDPIEFLHPDAPRLVVGRSTLEFERTLIGERRTTFVDLRNAGRREARVSLRIRGGEGAFRLHRGSGPSIRLATEPVLARVDFVPKASGEFKAYLLIESEDLEGARKIVLVGSADDPKPSVLSSAVADSGSLVETGSTAGKLRAASAEDPVAEPSEEDSAVLPDPRRHLDLGSPELLSDEELLVMRIVPTGLGTAQVFGAISRRGVEVLVRRRGAIETVWRGAVSQGRFRVDVLAAVGQDLEVALALPGANPRQFFALGLVRPVIRKVSSPLGHSLVVQGVPRRPFLLSQVLLGADQRPVRALQTWRGHFGDRGNVTLPVSLLLGPEASDVDLIVTVEAKDPATGKSRAVHSHRLHLRAGAR